MKLDNMWHHQNNSYNKLCLRIWDLMYLILMKACARIYNLSVLYIQDWRR